MATKKDVEAERNIQEIAKIQREGKIAAVRSYLVSGCSVMAGIPMFAIGGLEYIEPDMLDLVKNGFEFLGYGAVLVGGPGAMKVVGAVINSVNGN